MFLVLSQDGLNLIPEHFFLFNYVLIAICFGLILKNFTPRIKTLKSGIDFTSKIQLYIGIVLLGPNLNLIKIFELGISAVLMVSTSIIIVILFSGWLFNRVFSNERWDHFVVTGIGICGISAMIALSFAMEAIKEPDGLC